MPKGDSSHPWEVQRGWGESPSISTCLPPEPGWLQREAGNHLAGCRTTPRCLNSHRVPVRFAPKWLNNVGKVPPFLPGAYFPGFCTSFRNNKGILQFLSSHVNYRAHVCVSCVHIITESSEDLSWMGLLRVIQSHPLP